MQIITPRRREEWTSRLREFERTDLPGAGFAFECDAAGVVTPTNPDSAANLARALSDPTILDRGVRAYHHSYTHPAIGRCDSCGRAVALEGFTNTCDCGADYNSAGQRLAPREQWGEETGETAADILRGGDGFEEWDR